jgi:hypothetical protein
MLWMERRDIIGWVQNIDEDKWLKDRWTELDHKDRFLENIKNIYPLRYSNNMTRGIEL